MTRTRIITLLVVLALALSVVAPAFAATEQARLPWRALAELFNWLEGDPWRHWGFFYCFDDETYWYLFHWPENWREYPDWLLDEYKDYWNDVTGTTFGPCGHGSGVQNGDIYP